MYMPTEEWAAQSWHQVAAALAGHGGCKQKPLVLFWGAPSKRLPTQAWLPHAAWAWLSLPTEEMAGKAGMGVCRSKGSMADW